MADHEKQYQQAFNNGYLIAKHDPELFSQLSQSVNHENEYFKGLLSGGKEYEREINKDHSKAKHQPAKDKDFEKER